MYIKDGENSKTGQETGQLQHDIVLKLSPPPPHPIQNFSLEANGRSSIWKQPMDAERECAGF